MNVWAVNNNIRLTLDCVDMDLDGLISLTSEEALWQDVCVPSETTVVPPVTFDRLESLYSIADRRAVRLFLQEHPAVASILTDGFDWIQVCFPTGEPSIQILPDPEIPNRVQLYVSVQVDMDPGEANTRLNNLDELWWNQVNPGIARLVCVDVDYK